MEQKALNNNLNSQIHLFKEGLRLKSYEQALTQRDGERALIKSGKSPYSKVKVVRHGPKRSTSGEYFELRMYVLKNPPKEEKSKKDIKKPSKKGKKQK